MNKDEIKKIITLGDIFANLETEEQAFKFLKYIKNQQQELERLNNIINETKKLVNIAFEPDSQYIDYDFGAELLKQTFIDILYNDIGIDGKELKGE